MPLLNLYEIAVNILVQYFEKNVEFENTETDKNLNF